jgi:uncharacterized protein (DUF58 family)
MVGIVINEAFLQQVEALQTLLKNNVGGLFGGNRKSRTYGTSVEFADHREYADGDDTTKINWKIFARSDKLYVKQYLDERQMHTRIYIDASRSMAYGKGEKATQALQLAAALAYLSVAEMDKVSVYTIRGGRVETVISGVVGKEAYFAAVHRLNEIEFGGDCRISEAILPEPVGYGDGMSILISDFLTDSDYERAIEHFAAKKRHAVCLQVLSAEERHPQIRGKVHFFDSENMEDTYRKNIDREIAAAYKAALAAITGRIRDVATASGGDYLLVPAEASLGEVLFGQMVDVGVLK